MIPPIGMAELKPPRISQGPASRGQKVYEMRVEGHTWQEIADKLGFSDRSNAIASAKLYAIKSGKPQLSRRARSHGKRTKRQLAYELRDQWGFGWDTIAQFAGYRNGGAARYSAHHHAADYQLPLPREWPRFHRR